MKKKITELLFRMFFKYFYLVSATLNPPPLSLIMTYTFHVRHNLEAQQSISRDALITTEKYSR